jgi:multicomponent Na+:H+ antiporter subunit C
MLLRRSIVKLLIGLALLTLAVNLLIFAAGGLTETQPPIIPTGATQLDKPYADPLPQALVLTAIVINLGVQAFFIVLIQRVTQTANTDDLDELKGPE